MTRWACGVTYAGTGFRGWQTQSRRDGEPLAIQDAVESALSTIAGEPVATRCAGRTDAGVHAIGQVVQFDCAAERDASAWVRGTRAHLPTGVALRWARPVGDDFDARFSALARTYWYLLRDGPEASPLWDGRAGASSRPLDPERLALASARLVGTHDFSAFRSSECQAKSPVRTIESVRWRRQGAFLLMAVTANAFLHHMVRNLVGSLVYVGDGRRPVDWLDEVLASRDRARAAPTFAAAGLYLVAVRYDARFDLPTAEPPFDLCALA